MRHSKIKKWIEENQNKHFCNCGCGKSIKIIKSQYYEGVPKYIQGHNRRNPEIEKFIKENQGRYFCICPCHKLIIITKSHYYYGIPKYIVGHNTIGTHHTDEEKENLRLKMKGRVFSNTWKQKISDSKMGIKNAAYGKPPSKGCGIGKRSYYNSPFQGMVCFRSSYELAYAKYLDSIGELWYYEIKTFDLVDMTYTPDFFLPRTDKFIEIKGYMCPKHRKAINKFLQLYPNKELEILFKNDLINLGIIL